MRGLFKLESARVRAAVLIVAGVILIIAAFIVNRIGFGQAIGAAIWENGIALLCLGLGIVFIVIGSTVNKLCAAISQMMQTYDEELHKRLSEIKSDCNSKDSTSENP